MNIEFHSAVIQMEWLNAVSFLLRFFPRSTLAPGNLTDARDFLNNRLNVGPRAYSGPDERLKNS